jgi:hypothetical protein
MSQVGALRILARDDLERVGQPRFALQEVRQLWTFLDGAIMAVDTRHRLWRGWGLCPRHAWGYTVAELELRGGRPFSTSVLYEDLIGRARRLLERTRMLPWPVVADRFRPRALCSTCDFLSIQPTYAEDHAERMTQLMNRMRRTRQLLRDLSPLWMPSSCPQCLGGEAWSACGTCSPGPTSPTAGRSWSRGCATSSGGSWRSAGR